MNSRTDIFSQQARNKRKAMLLFLLYVSIFALAGAGVDLAMNRQFGGGLFLSIWTIPVMVIMLGHMLWRAGRSVIRLLLPEAPTRNAWSDGAFDSSMFIALAGLVTTFGLFFYWKMTHDSYMAVQYGTPTALDKFVVHGATMYFPLPFATLGGLLFGVISGVWGYFKGTQGIIALGGMARTNVEEPEDRQFMNIIEEVSIAAGLPAPQVCILPDDDPNAFAIGTREHGYSIVATSGLLKALDRDELQGVIAHEFGHIRNQDTKVMTLVSILFGSILLISAFARRGMVFGAVLERRKFTILGGVAGLVLWVVWLLTVLLAPIASRVMAMAISRNREYHADAAAAELTRNPSALVRALEKLEAAVEPTRAVKSGLEHLCIVDPLGHQMNNREGFWANLLSTHPPIRKRIMYLKAMAYEGPALTAT